MYSAILTRLLSLAVFTLATRNTKRTALVLAVLLWVATASPSLAVTIAWSPVGNAGNAADTTVMSDGTSGYGSVPYAYKIGTYDVTNSQYVEFLNTKDSGGANSLGLWNSNMANTSFGGINFNAGNANGSKYTLISGAQNHPVNFVTWFDAIRFANWLDNGQGTGDTENGAYMLQGGTPTPSNANSIARQPGATIVIPSENEWYKAAFYDPRTTAQGGPLSDSHYWLYPTSSNVAPTVTGPTATPNSANYNSAVDTLTDVGAYSGTTSPYGAFDMGGNVFQWNEVLIGGSSRGIRGVAFGDNATYLQSWGRLSNPATDGPFSIGFRIASIASVPEPPTCLLLLTGVLMICFRRRAMA